MSLRCAGWSRTDRQQIEALQEQVQRLNDRLAEFEHGGGAGGGSESGKRLAALEARLSKLEAPPTATPAGGAAAVAAPAGMPNAGGVPAGAAAAMPAAAINPSSTPSVMPSGTETAAVTPPPAAVSPPPAPPAPEAEAPAPAPDAAPPPTASAARPLSWMTLAAQELAVSHSDPGAKLYLGGLTEMREGRYQAAAAKFQEMQRKYPKSELSEAAEYFSANAFFELGKFDQSILQFNDLTMRFPRGRLASASLLREAEAFMKMNDRIDARLTLQKLIDDQPDSAEAAAARPMLQSLVNG